MPEFACLVQYKINKPKTISQYSVVSNIFVNHIGIFWNLNAISKNHKKSSYEQILCDLLYQPLYMAFHRSYIYAKNFKKFVTIHYVGTQTLNLFLLLNCYNIFMFSGSSFNTNRIFIKKMCLSWDIRYVTIKRYRELFKN